MKYRRPSRLRRVAVSVGRVSAVLLIVTMAASLLWCIQFYPSNLSAGVLFQHGRVEVFWDPATVGAASPMSLRCWMMPIPFEIHWWFSWMPGPPRRVSIPIWFLLVTVAVPTTILWHNDRRPPKGHCQACGYDLTGNVSGRCPECGTATERIPDRTEP